MDACHDKMCLFAELPMFLENGGNWGYQNLIIQRKIVEVY